MNSDEGGVPKRQLIPDLLAAIFRHLLDRPNFSSLFCESLGGTVINEIYLEDLCSALHLSLPEKISLGLALADANTIEMRTSGKFAFIIYSVTVDQVIHCFCFLNHCKIC